MDSLLQDLRYAARTLLKNPGFTAAAVVTLALGIGANTAIFSVVDGVLLRPAPFEAMDRLAMVWETDRKSNTIHEPASVPDFVDFQRRSVHFQRFAAFAAAEVNLTPEGGDPSRLAALVVTHEFLPVIGVRPLLGRTFNEEEDRPGGPPVALISESLWEQLFARDPQAIGRTLRINDVPRTIVGVLPSFSDWISTLKRTSGKSVTASTSITPQAWLAESPESSRPIDLRTLLRAPSQPTTKRAFTVSVLPS